MRGFPAKDCFKLIETFCVGVLRASSPLVSIPDLEVLKEGFEVVLGGEAGVGEVAGSVVPFAEAAVVEEFEFFRDDEGDDVVSQAFFEENEPSHSAVAVL